MDSNTEDHRVSNAWNFLSEFFQGLENYQKHQNMWPSHNTNITAYYAQQSLQKI